MSGIAGIFRRDGAPVNPSLLQALTRFQAFRGPDGQEVWLDGPIGFGHTMLSTTRQAANERQPAALEGRYWITADVRLDARGELIEKLQSRGEGLGPGTITDPELILHAYRQWGEGCVDFLRGDFAFAIWDAAKRQLFCARDHFGVKPFFYAVNEKQFLFSNTLNCLRAHPDVSDELNEAAIGDFLLFGWNCDIANTVFRELHRLPAAHLLVVRSSDVVVRRYWEPPVDGSVQYQKESDYVEQFDEILRNAAADRLGVRSTGIFLSGGLDSGAVAAAAAGIKNGCKADIEHNLLACTIVYDEFVRSDEERYAQETAKFLNIPLTTVSIEKFPMFSGWDNLDKRPPEPIEEPFWVAWHQRQATVAKSARVALSGDGADNLLDFEVLPYARDLLRRGMWATLATQTLQYLWVRPFPTKGLRHRLGMLFGNGPDEPVYPTWLSKDFEQRQGLSDRWRSNPMVVAPTHACAPRGHASLTFPHWTYTFELADPGITRYPVETRYPFFDLRMVNFLLGIPRFPWAFEKHVIRKAMQGRLPEGTRLRKKTPLQGNPIAAALQRSGPWVAQDTLIERELEPFINVRKLRGLRPAGPTADGLLIRPLCLNFWLQCARREYNVNEEGLNGRFSQTGRETWQKSL